jgi:hypothetical protein
MKKDLSEQERQAAQQARPSKGKRRRGRGRAKTPRELEAQNAAAAVGGIVSTTPVV